MFIISLVQNGQPGGLSREAAQLWGACCLFTRIQNRSEGTAAVDQHGKDTEAKRTWYVSETGR